MRLHGIDTSHWDGVIRWGEVRVSGQAYFAIHKCTEGTGFFDSQFNNNRAGTVAQTIPWAGYHFYLPAYGPLKQADWFLSKLGTPYPRLMWNDLETGIADTINVMQGEVRIRPGADYERWQKALSLAGRNRTQLETIKGWVMGLPTDAKAWRDRVKQYGQPGIYTSPGFWMSFFDPPPAWPAEDPLWIAHVGVETPIVPKPWTDYAIWQYAWNGQIPGIDAAVDVNWFNGDGPQLLAFFGNGTLPAVPGTNWKFKVLTDGLSVRTGPGTSYPKVGSLAKGTEVAADDFRVAKDSWVHHDGGGWSAVYYTGQGLHMEQII